MEITKSQAAPSLAEPLDVHESSDLIYLAMERCSSSEPLHGYKGGFGHTYIGGCVFQVEAPGIKKTTHPTPKWVGVVVGGWRFDLESIAPEPI